MAMQMICKTIYNINAVYWCVAYVQTDRINKQAFITIVGYPNKKTRDLSKKDTTITYIDSRSFNVGSNNFDKYFSVEALRGEENNQYKQAYLYLKEHTEFRESIDLVDDEENNLTMADIVEPMDDIENVDYYEENISIEESYS